MRSPTANPWPLFLGVFVYRHESIHILKSDAHYLHSNQTKYLQVEVISSAHKSKLQQSDSSFFKITNLGIVWNIDNLTSFTEVIFNPIIISQFEAIFPDSVITLPCLDNSSDTFINQCIFHSFQTAYGELSFITQEQHWTRNIHYCQGELYTYCQW